MDALSLLCRAHALPEPQREYRFLPPRRWRFDYAWVDALVAIECEGGAWIRGRHTRGIGFINDMAKYNAAQLAGWIVLRYTPQQLTQAATLETLRTILCLDSIACRRRPA